MRAKNIKDIKPGEILGKTIYRSDGTPLLTKGSAVTLRILNRIEEEGMVMLYIEDDISEGIEPTNVFSDTTLIKGISSVHHVHFDIQDKFRIPAKDYQNLSYVYESLHLDALTSVIDDIENEIYDNSENLYQVMNISSLDAYTFKHSMDVASLAMLIGKEMGMNQNDVKLLGYGGLLHDIGKAHVPEDIVQKPFALNDSEWEEMRKHPVYGYNLVKDVITLHGHVKQMVLFHHERLDGSGYPFQLKSDKISKFVRIIAVSDMFNAMASDTVYKEAMTPDKILEALYADAVYKIDKDVVQALLKVIHIYPEGTVVKLSNNRQAIVLESRKIAPTRPLVLLLNSTKRIDLMEDLTVFIEQVV